MWCPVQDIASGVFHNTSCCAILYTKFFCIKSCVSGTQVTCSKTHRVCFQSTPFLRLHAIGLITKINMYIFLKNISGKIVCEIKRIRLKPSSFHIDCSGQHLTETPYFNSTNSSVIW